MSIRYATPPMRSRMDDHLDPCMRALAMWMDDISKAVQTICVHLDERLKETPSSDSQIVISKRRNREKKHPTKKTHQFDEFETQASSNNKVPSRLEG
ncbi:hypothetical protein Nepgr_026602 [Nepenthes gracilis]|uniref:Uncharacterized protein n=1 Tax=Nepenthes gracilis TaxID=150966 RepID=A0AAD3T8P6_NEPGR|nr:hypothetical protein Nepgr_026602 [Nepenthes gracilis]